MPLDLKPEKILFHAAKQFLEETGYTPFVASELEFYISSHDDSLGERLLADVRRRCDVAMVKLNKTDREVAKGQYEVAVEHSSDLLAVARSTVKLKEIVVASAAALNVEANFTPKPFNNLPGSGLHIHFSIRDRRGKPLFAKELDADQESQHMRWCLGGMLDLMLESMVFFAPNAESYARFTPHNDVTDTMRYNNVPTNVSWGGNNRTVALRIPSSTHMPEMRHIEHRVSGSDADPGLAIAVVVIAAMHGIINKIEPSTPKIWGNAYDSTYTLQELPKTLRDAQNYFNKGTVLRKVLKEYSSH